MYAYMGIMPRQALKPYEDSFWEKNRINLVYDHVSTVDFDRKTVKTKKEVFFYDKLIIATGSTYRRHPLIDDNISGVTGMYSIQDLDYIEAMTEHTLEAVIIGGGLIGIELAEMLHAKGIETHIVTREGAYWNNILPWEEAAMISKHIIHHGIHLHRSEQIRKILTEDNRVRGIVTEEGQEITCQFVGVTIGVEPNVSFLRDTKLEIDRGILVDEYLRTSVKDVYAIGDCVELRHPDPLRRATEPVWYTARKMGEVAALNICGKPKKYNQGTWFNSAKFLDIEYQTYGYVPHQLEDEGLKSLLWLEPKSEQLIRLVVDAKSQAVKGINLLGIRWRHAVCEEWIASHRTLPEILPELDRAHFDQEFKPYYQNQLIALYNEQFSGNLVPGRNKSSFLSKIFSR